MKFNFEKIAFYFMIIAVSGSVGYALKPDPPIEQVSFNQKNEACVRAMSMMQFISKQTYYANKKTKKELAIERMQRNQLPIRSIQFGCFQRLQRRQDYGDIEQKATLGFNLGLFFNWCIIYLSCLFFWEIDYAFKPCYKVF